MKKTIFLAVTLLTNIAWAKLNVVTTTPDIAYMVKKIGGSKVNVESLLDGTEDPHYVDAMPHYIQKVAKADAFCMVGLDLEIGWVPKVLGRSGNAQVQKGGKGYCDTGSNVSAIEKPHGHIDRSMGDVHPAGNPHYHLGPDEFMEGAEVVFSTLVNLDPNNVKFYTAQYEALDKEVRKVQKAVLKALKKSKKLVLMEYHKEFSYFIKAYGLSNTEPIEEVPGVPPSAGRLARMAIKAKREKVSLVIATPTNPTKLLRKFHEMSKIKIARIPFGMRKHKGPKSFKSLQFTIAKAILKGTKKSKK